jgi:D-alanyl-D-alanine dipeptidase
MLESRRGGLIAAALAFLTVVTAVTAIAANRLPAGFAYLRDVAPSIRQDMRYAGANNFTGHRLPGYHAGECILRTAAARALKRVQADLTRAGYTLKVYDCYRPTRAVAAMARWARDPNAKPDTTRFYPGLPKSKLFELGYIAAHSAHSRGVAVDLTIVPRNAAPAEAYNPNAAYGSCTGPLAARAPDDSLDMGTAYDCFSTKSHTSSAAITSAQRANRTILRDAMTRHGFQIYRQEWWHFSFPAADPRAEYDFPVAPR